MSAILDIPDASPRRSLARRRQEELAQELLGTAYANLTPTQQDVIDLVAAEAPSRVAPALSGDDRTPWERLADTVARVGGSWSFIGGFAAALGLWMGWNLLAASRGAAFDPYPFIFLNLILSMLAAVQAPIILMSQNRQAAKDRIAARHDYEVNLRTQLEILRLSRRIDRFTHLVLRNGGGGADRREDQEVDRRIGDIGREPGE